MAVIDRLAKCFEASFAFDAAKITPDTMPESVPKWDSLGHMNLIAQIEKEFNVRFEVDEIMEMASVARILEILKAKGATD